MKEVREIFIQVKFGFHPLLALSWRDGSLLGHNLADLTDSETTLISSSTSSTSSFPQPHSLCLESDKYKYKYQHLALAATALISTREWTPPVPFLVRKDSLFISTSIFASWSHSQRLRAWRDSKSRGLNFTTLAAARSIGHQTLKLRHKMALLTSCMKHSLPSRQARMFNTIARILDTKEHFMPGKLTSQAPCMDKLLTWSIRKAKSHGNPIRGSCRLCITWQGFHPTLRSFSN